MNVSDWLLNHRHIYINGTTMFRMVTNRIKHPLFGWVGTRLKPLEREYNAIN